MCVIKKVEKRLKNTSNFYEKLAKEISGLVRHSSFRSGRKGKYYTHKALNAFSIDTWLLFLLRGFGIEVHPS